MVEIQSGVWRLSKDEIIEEQKTWHEEDPSKNFDFSIEDFWILTNDGFILFDKTFDIVCLR